MVGEESNPSVIIDVETLENYLKTNKIMGNIGNMNKSTICKVKASIGENVYEPVVVSIGPYHHKRRTLQAMENKKWNWMNYILKISRKTNLEGYIKELTKIEHIARTYYAKEIKMESSKFVEMLLLDGFFVLVSLYAIDLVHYHTEIDFDEKEYSHNKLEMLDYYFIAHDLLLVENQIPFFVMRILYDLFIGEQNAVPSLSEKYAHFVEQILHCYPKSIKESSRPRDFHHLLHLCHIYLRPSQNGEYFDFTQFTRDNQLANCWHQVAQYNMVGVNLIKREFDENYPHSLLDVRFIDNVLQIPFLTIDENTSCLFKSLIELEQKNLDFGNDITAYIFFMSQLVKEAKDVALLVSKGIIRHDLRSEEEVVDMFIKLNEGVVFDFSGSFYLKNICHDLELYYRSRTKWWVVWFRRTTSAIRGRFF